jgi:hypothetical protein
MVIAGTKHFKGNLQQTGNQDNEKSIYEALRYYNSGSINVNVSDPYPKYQTCFLTFRTESF